MKSTNKLVNEMVHNLKEPDREIFMRRYFLGERIKAIVIALNLDEKFIENKLYTVKKKLKKGL